ncbi:hypothetical protein JCM3765_006038 [Sporobolomyces pararoseus]
MSAQSSSDSSIHPVTSRSPFLNLPPELLSLIISFCNDPSHSYHQHKCTFARLCLVNRRFLPIARSQLYSKVTLFTHEGIKSKQDWLERQPQDSALVATLSHSEICSSLVKEVHVAKSQEMVKDIAIGISRIALQAESLQKIWCLQGVRAEERISQLNETVDVDEEDEENEDHRATESETRDGDGEQIATPGASSVPEGTATVEDDGVGESPTEKGEDETEEGERNSSGSNSQGSGTETNDGHQREEENSSQSTISRARYSWTTRRNRLTKEALKKEERKALSELCDILVTANSPTLKVLVVPDLPLSSLHILSLFVSLDNLKVYKGPHFDTVFRAQGFKFVTPLRRLWITTSLTRSTLDHLLPCCSTTLRFLNFSITGESGSLPLGGFPHLESLCIEIVVPRSSIVIDNPLGAGGIRIVLIPGDIIQKALQCTVDSIRSLNSPDLVTFALDMDLDSLRDQWTDPLQQIFANLPPSLSEFAIGRVDTSSLPRLALVDHIHRYCSLTRLRIVSPRSERLDATSASIDNNDSSSISWFHHPNLSINRAVETVEVSRKEWKEWKLREFYPEAKPHFDPEDLAEEEEEEEGGGISTACRIM